MKKPINKRILWLSVPAVLLLTVQSVAGMFYPPTYAFERSEWANQAVAQDMMNLIVTVPLLLLTSVLAAMNSRRSLLIWGGINFFLAYNFAIYAFDIHFNRFFVLYCVEFGLAFYSAIYLLLKAGDNPVHGRFRRSLLTISGVFFMLIAISFAGMWLKQDLRMEVLREPDAALARLGLPTNPVHVLDLSIVLPGLFIVGILNFRNKQLGRLLSVPVLVFCLLMSMAVGWLVYASGLAGYNASAAITFAMCGVSLGSLYLLSRFILRSREETVN